MARIALFEGLIIDEYDHPVDVTFIGGEACYVVDDAGFKRHISSEDVDRQVLVVMKKQVEGHEDLLSEETAKMIGQDDIFTRAMLIQQFKQIDQQFEALLQTGIPAEGRTYLGMMGFRIIINVHGEVLEVLQPGMSSGGDREE